MDSKERARAKRYRDCFDLSIEEWELVNAYQKGLCWFCKKSQKSGKRLAVDHNHTSGESRGLLCSQCNRLLGKIERLWTLQILAVVIEYLKDPPLSKIIGRQAIGFPGRVGTKRHKAWLKKRSK